METYLGYDGFVIHTGSPDLSINTYAGVSQVEFFLGGPDEIMFEIKHASCVGSMKVPVEDVIYYLANREDLKKSLEKRLSLVDGLKKDVFDLKEKLRWCKKERDALRMTVGLLGESPNWLEGTKEE